MTQLDQSAQQKAPAVLSTLASPTSSTGLVGHSSSSSSLPPRSGDTTEQEPHDESPFQPSAASLSFDPQPTSGPQTPAPQANFFPFRNRAHPGSLFFNHSTPPDIQNSGQLQPTNFFMGRPPFPGLALPPDHSRSDPRFFNATNDNSMAQRGPQHGRLDPSEETEMLFDDDFVPSTQLSLHSFETPAADGVSFSQPEAGRRSARVRRATTRFSPSEFTPMRQHPGGTVEQLRRQEIEIAQQAEHYQHLAYEQDFRHAMTHRHKTPSKRDRLNDPSPEHDEWSGSSPTIDSSRNTPPPNFGREGYDRIGLCLYGKVNNIVQDMALSRKITDRILESEVNVVIGLLRNSERLFQRLNEVADSLASEASAREAIVQDFHLSSAVSLAQPSVTEFFLRLPPPPREGPAI